MLRILKAILYKFGNTNLIFSHSLNTSTLVKVAGNSLKLLSFLSSTGRLNPLLFPSLFKKIFKKSFPVEFNLGEELEILPSKLITSFPLFIMIK